MKICKNCNSKIEDDALVCPYCGCVTKKGGKGTVSQDNRPVTRSTNGNAVGPQKKRKIWLWVIGWIFIFPLPLTILLLRNQKLNKGVKIAIIAVAWIIYLLIAFAGGSGDSNGNKNMATTSDSEAVTSSDETAGNIKSFEFSKDDDVTVKVGKTDSSGSLKVKVKSTKDFTPEDVVFVSDNPEVATITFTRDSLTTTLYYEITGINGGETDVYATSADGSVKSGTIHVIVPEPIRIEAIELGEVRTDLVIGEVEQVKATISPADAEDRTLTWSSSDTTVATVDEEGNVAAVGGGTATIKATSSNGVETSFDVNVDGTKTLMNVKTTHRRDDDVNIGDEWGYDIEIDGEWAPRQMGIAVGQTLSFSAKITESDDNPDVGTGSATYTVTEENLVNGFEISFDVYVTENGGRNSGQSAHFLVTYTFSPN